MKQSLLPLLLLISINSFAANLHEDETAIVCQSVPVITQNDTGQRLFLIKNLSGDALLISHPVTPDPGVSAGWSSELNTNKWSAIAIDHANFIIKCAKIRPGAYEPVDCQMVIAICSYPHTEFAQTAKGTYWVSESKSHEELLKEISNRNIVLR